ncbi:VanZ family protein [Agromyces bauzanensis]|uniref:VanZ-like domain-containing protein n=1 Tax=Agromyces bauzanensis TaxID=1308924 RepID=A0A917PSK0_9MICO|nr:VanZ family protein [Agromyces bauzanensis]GGJ90110.1 hypothetical protein GCM10011372_30800 [Agromyces bauzanensis]
MPDPQATRSGPRTARAAARVILAPYLVALALIVFLPARDAGRVTGIVGWAADLVATWGVPREPAAIVFEFVANAVLFVPFGLLVSAAAPRWSPLVVIGLGCLVSITIELAQLGIPSRVPTVSDVIANVAGVAGECVVVWWRRMSQAGRTACPDRSVTDLGSASPDRSSDRKPWTSALRWTRLSPRANRNRLASAANRARSVRSTAVLPNA